MASGDCIMGRGWLAGNCAEPNAYNAAACLAHSLLRSTVSTSRVFPAKFATVDVAPAAGLPLTVMIRSPTRRVSAAMLPGWMPVTKTAELLIPDATKTPKLSLRFGRSRVTTSRAKPSVSVEMSLRLWKTRGAITHGAALVTCGRRGVELPGAVDTPLTVGC